MKTKKCTLCNRTLPITAFGVNNTSSDKLQSWCKECDHTYSELRVKYKEFGGVKLCKRCRRLLPKSDFYKSNGHSKDGYQSYCKQCCKETSIASRHKETAVDLCSISDVELIQVLRARGFTGRISKKVDYDI